MEALGLLLGGATGLFGSILLGLHWGKALRRRPSWRYWTANACVLAGGVLMAYIGILCEWSWLWAASLGTMGGGLTGLKYGLGKTTGVWRAVDRVTGSKDLPRE